MYYEWYIDLFFLENTMMDAILLLLLGIALRRKSSIPRIFLASVLGGIGACILALVRIENQAWALALQAGLAVLMVRTGFGKLDGRRLLKSVAVFYALAFCMAGILEAASARVNLPVTVSGLAAAVLMAVLLKGFQDTKSVRENFCQVTMSLHGVSKSVKGFRDTGNQLRDPYLGRPVAVVERRAIEEFLNQKVKVLWIPYHSIGHDGAMAAFTLDYMLIEKEDGIKRVERPLVAVSREKVSSKGNCQMILPSALVDD